jgi:hypothetical protein
MAVSRKRLRVGPFLQQYGRKAHRGHDPNDRRYDRKIEQAIKALTPEEFDELLQEEGGGTADHDR